MKFKAMLLTILLSITVAVAGEAGMMWDEATGAEGYYVYWRTPNSTYNVVDVNFYPVCEGYYDTTPPTLIPLVTCVFRTLPAIQVTGLPDEPPVLVLALKGVNEIGLSTEFSNEVMKHNLGADPTGNARRTEVPPPPGP